MIEQLQLRRPVRPLGVRNAKDGVNTYAKEYWKAFHEAEVEERGLAAHRVVLERNLKKRVGHIGDFSKQNGSAAHFETIKIGGIDYTDLRGRLDVFMRATHLRSLELISDLQLEQTPMVLTTDLAQRTLELCVEQIGCEDVSEPDQWLKPKIRRLFTVESAELASVTAKTVGFRIQKNDKAYDVKTRATGYVQLDSLDESERSCVEAMAAYDPEGTYGYDEIEGWRKRVSHCLAERAVLFPTVTTAYLARVTQADATERTSS